MDCIELHKLAIFSCDTAELQCYYMQQGVKNPTHVPVGSFMVQMGLLDNYLAHLSTVKDSPMAVEDRMKGNVPFDQANLARIMLKAIPSSWVNQYNLTNTMLPKSPRQWLPDLENIKSVMNKKRVETAMARAKNSAASAGMKSGPTKRSLRKLALQSSVSIERTAAGPTRPTTLRNVASMTKTKRLFQPLPKSPTKISPTRSMGVGMTSRWLIYRIPSSHL